jgi:serine/threonine-protein kinase
MDSGPSSTDDPDRTAAEARLGTVLRGKYTIDSVLGAGGMAVVYAVTHRNRKRFAVKMLHAELSRQPSMRERFLREGYVANTVGHPGAVAVLDDDVDENGAAYLVMELLEGKSVDRLWEDSGRRMPSHRVVSIVHQLLDVLSAAHGKGIVHRDIKPANLFLTSDGQLKVLDFGIARLREADVRQTTNTGALFGTPAFMSPEQAAGRFKEVDEQTDVWAVGATMFTMLTGRIVHDAENAHALLVAAATRDPPGLATLAPETPPELCAVVDRALARNKADRWRTAAEMREALDAAHRNAFGTEITRRRPTSLAPPDAALLRTVEADKPDGKHVSPPGAEAPSPDSRTGISPLAATAATAPTEMSASLQVPHPSMPDATSPGWTSSPASRLALRVGVPAFGAITLLGAYFLFRTPAVPQTSAAADVPASASPPPSTTPLTPPAETTGAVAPADSPPAPSPVSTTPQTAPAPRPSARPTPTATARASATPKAAASTGDCFYFDAKLNRIVAKPGCR